MPSKFIVILVFPWFFSFANMPRSIQFGIPESKIVNDIPKKTQDCATVIPWHRNTYIYNKEGDYYADYRRSYYAVTCKKGGWDCLRHYEILANGCIPFFVGLGECPDKNMVFLPKELIKRAMRLRGVIYNGYKVTIDHKIFDRNQYFVILQKLIDHTRRYLTCKAMGEYLLTSVGYSEKKPVLYLSEDLLPDYLRCLTLVGLKQRYGAKIVDVIKVPHIYKSYQRDVSALYGKGMTYTRILDDLMIDRKNIRERIENREFEYIIYGSCHRGLAFHNLVKHIYPREKIIFLCGEDIHECRFRNQPNLFLREFLSG